MTHESDHSGRELFENLQYQPGNVFSYDVDKVSDFLYESELSNGRIAMLAVAGIMGSELLTGQSFF